MRIPIRLKSEGNALPGLCGLGRDQSLNDTATSGRRAYFGQWFQPHGGVAILRLPLCFVPVLVLVLTMSVAAGSAWATEPFQITKFENTITNEEGEPATQAGSHPYAMTTAFELASHEGEEKHAIPDGELKELEVGLPAGVIVNPQATKIKCTEAELDTKFHCPNASAIGVAAIGDGLSPEIIGHEPVYNMIPPPGVPAELGFAVTGAGVVVHIYGNTRTGGDYGLFAKVADVLERADLYSTALTLWGDPTAESHDKERGLCLEHGGSCPVARRATPLLTLPTACTGKPLKATISIDSWQEPGNYQTKEVTSPAVTGCEAEGLHFTPTLSARPADPEVPSTESPTGLEVNLKIPQEESITGLAESDLKEAVVTLPAGMAVSPSGANGLGVCTDMPEPNRPGGEIALTSAEPVECPSDSKLGTVEVITPLLEQPLNGAVYVAQQGNLPGNGSNPFGSLFALYLVAEGSGALVKLPGEIELNPATGQLTARFGEDPATTLSTGTKQFLPQLPFSELKMHFFGGPRAPLVTPSSCGAYTTTSQLTPWDGQRAAEPASNFAVSSGCGARTFSPQLTAGMESNQAGAFSDETVTIVRNDGEQNLSGITITTPPGLLGLLSKVPLCQEPQASQGTCGEASEIGEATEAVGPGEDPYWVKGGRVYLTGPYNHEPFGLSIVNPTTAGPFTLEGNGGFGKEVTRASIAVNPKTGALTIASGSLPTILEGVPLDVRTVNVDVNRKEFTFNPTNCEEFHVTSSITSTSGATATPSSRFQAANCAALPFKPSLSASTQGKTSKADGASLHVKLVPPHEGPQSTGTANASGTGSTSGSTSGTPGNTSVAQTEESNIASVKVELPKQLPSRLTTLQKACTSAQFDSNPAGCPSASVVASAKAITPILPVPLEGPAYFVSHGNEAFPQLILVLQGYGITIDLVGDTFISKSGITSSTFAHVPDAPVSSFELTLPEGKFSALAANGNLCKPTKTVTVKKKVTVKVHGRKRTVTRSVKQTVAEPLTMPTEFVAQNGAELKQDTKIEVTGCPKAKAAKKPAKKGKKKK
jgi:hypothetical protein